MHQTQADNEFIAEIELCLDSVVPEELMLVDLLRKLEIEPGDIEDYSLVFTPGDKTDDYSYLVVTCLKTPMSQHDSNESASYRTSLSLYQDRISQLNPDRGDDTTLSNQLRLAFNSRD